MHTHSIMGNFPLENNHDHGSDIDPRIPVTLSHLFRSQNSCFRAPPEWQLRSLYERKHFIKRWFNPLTYQQLNSDMRDRKQTQYWWNMYTIHSTLQPTVPFFFLIKCLNVPQWKWPNPWTLKKEGKNRRKYCIHMSLLPAEHFCLTFDTVHNVISHLSESLIQSNFTLQKDSRN